MRPTTPTEQSACLYLDPVALNACTEAALVSPGFVQAYGVLLVLRGPDLTIRQVSDNLEHLLGVAPDDVLNQPLKTLFSSAQHRYIVQNLTQVYAGVGTAFEVKSRARKHPTDPTATGHSLTFRGQLHPIDDGVILELEPKAVDDPRDVSGFYHRLQSAILGDLRKRIYRILRVRCKGEASGRELT
jgi:light-regulated signal transduction histidine kinase (bacteriophytochrome)